jgi:nucleoside-diphosphate kinase
MGATDPKKADPGTIRKDLGLDLQRNSVHGSILRKAPKERSVYISSREIIQR